MTASEQHAERVESLVNEGVDADVRTPTATDENAEQIGKLQGQVARLKGEADSHQERLRETEDMLDSLVCTLNGMGNYVPSRRRLPGSYGERPLRYQNESKEAEATGGPTVMVPDMGSDPQLAAHLMNTLEPAPQVSAKPPKWDRWHELLDLLAERALTTSEEQEYEEYAQLAAHLDAKEGRAADAALDDMVKEHERAIASIRRLTAAVRAAAGQHGGQSELMPPEATPKQFDFSHTLALLWAGKRVRRLGWTLTDDWLESTIYNIYLVNVAGDRGIWEPSMPSIFATDWVVVEGDLTAPNP